jgi:hypothetical protein
MFPFSSTAMIRPHRRRSQSGVGAMFQDCPGQGLRMGGPAMDVNINPVRLIE